MKLTLSLLVVTCLVFGGCFSKKPEAPIPAPQVGTVENLKPQLDLLNATIAKLQAGNAARLSKIGASAKTVDLYAGKLAESSEQRVIVAESRAIGAELAGVAITPEDELAATTRALLLYQGKFEEANNLYKQAAIEAKQRQEAQEQLKKDLDLVSAALSVTEKKLIAETVKNAKDIEDLQKAHAAELKKRDDAELKKQQMFIRGVGAVCLLAVIGLAVATGSITPGLLKRAAILLPCSALCFGLAQMIGKPWFMLAIYIVSGLVVITVIGVIVWVGREAVVRQREVALKQKEAEAAKKTSETLARTMTKITRAGDALYESADSELQKRLNDEYFHKLGTSMDDDEKATLHLMRAGEKLRKPVDIAAVIHPTKG